MIQSKYFPAYTPEDKKIAKARASLMLTYEQILTIASTTLTVLEQNKKLFKHLHLTEEEKVSLHAIHNACINCALSLETYEQGRDHAEK